MRMSSVGVSGKPGVAPEITDGLKMHAAHRGHVRQCKTKDVPDVIRVDIGHERWHQHHADIQLAAILDDRHFLFKQFTPADGFENLIACAVELQKDR